MSKYDFNALLGVADRADAIRGSTSLTLVEVRDRLRTSKRSMTLRGDVSNSVNH